MFRTPSQLINFFKAGLVVFAAYTIQDGSISLAEFVGLWSATNYISQALDNITTAFERLPDKFVDMHKLRDTIDKAPAIV